MPCVFFRPNRCTASSCGGRSFSGFPKFIVCLRSEHLSGWLLFYAKEYLSRLSEFRPEDHPDSGWDCRHKYQSGMKIIINPKYENLTTFIGKLAQPAFFMQHGKMLHDGRNVVKLFEAEGMKLVVKSYVRLSSCNRLLYGTLRKSKGMRAYLHAARLRNLGIGTPEEVAVVEVRRRGLMRHCYFVSRYTDYTSVRSATESFMRRDEAKPVLDALAQFLTKIHWAGVLLKDLNVGNILYRKEVVAGKEQYGFQVIDTNRMSFRGTLSVYRRLKNLRRLSCSAPAYLYILRQYAERIRMDADRIQLRGTVGRLLFEWRQRMKRKVKNSICGIPDVRTEHITHERAGEPLSQKNHIASHL